MTRSGLARNEGRRVGVYGGTFNPIHLGHLRSAEQVADALDLERIVFVPSAVPPHKGDDPSEEIAPAEMRRAWVELAVGDDPRFCVDGLEIERGGRSYSIDTMRTLVDRHAPRRLVFIIGHDAFVELGSWREPEALLALVDFAVTSRPPVCSGRLEAWLPACAKEWIDVAPDGRSGRHREAGTRIEIVEIEAVDVSSSQIREALRDGRSVEPWLDDRVWNAIRESGCYAARDQENNA